MIDEAGISLAVAASGELSLGGWASDEGAMVLDSLWFVGRVRCGGYRS